MKRFLMIILAIAIAMTFGCQGKKAADESRLNLTPDEEESKEITQNAYDFLLPMSESSATLREGFEQLSDDQGEFHEKNHYVYVYDFAGNCVAHAGDPSLRGQNLIKYADAEGTLIVEKMIENAQEKGEGWLSIALKNPDTDEIEYSHVYFKRLGDLDYVIGSGYFRK